MKIEQMKVDELIPYVNNARTHSDAQIAQIAASIKEFGWGAPLLIDKENGVIAGHARLLAARKLKHERVPCVRMSHLSDAQRKALIIADNRLPMSSGWDTELLAVEVDELRDMGFDLALLGFESAELNDLIGTPNEPPPGNTDPDEAPPVDERVRTRAGDVWVCGRHRIMCGDCRKSADVDRLIGKAKVNVAVTSPPYAEQRQYDESSGFRPIPPDEYVAWFKPVARNVERKLAADGSWFVNIKPSAEGLDTSLYVFDLVIAHVREWGWHFATEFCWERGGVPKAVRQRFKNQFEPVYQFAFNRWKMRPDAVRHESDNVPIPFGKGAGDTSWAQVQGTKGPIFGAAKKRPQGIRTSASLESVQGTNWAPGEYTAPGLAYPGNRLPTFSHTHDALGHAAAFPVGLPEFFIKAYSDAEDCVYDPFVGSGSTMIAAERTQRIGFAMELSPAYVDVSVKRWQAFTGNAATRESDGVRFDDAAFIEEKKT